MNFTIVCDVLGEVNNGTTLATLNLIHHLEKRGHHVTVVSPDSSKEGEENYYVVPTLNLGKKLNGYLAKNGVSLAKADDEILRKSMANADVVHVQMALFLGCRAVKIARELGKPITASFHCQAENITAHVGMMNCSPVNHLVYHTFYKKLYRYCNKVHYPTEFIREVFEDATDKTNAVVISNGVDEMFFQPMEHKKVSDKFIIVCSGRYSKEKAQWQLLKAVAASRHKDEIKVVLAGCGPFEESLRELAQKLDVDCVQRFFTRPELIKLFHSADLYVHTALIEIEAIACMEALVSGLVPVICNSERSATRYFALDDKNLFEPENIEDLRDKIDFWLEHPEVKAEYEKKYHEASQDFALNACMMKMEKMLISAAEEEK